MRTLRLAIIEKGPIAQQVLRDLIHSFETSSGIRVELEFLSWSTARNQLVNYALHGKGPDLAEIGSTWLSGFVSMNALRPFTEAELRSIVTPEAFIPSAWKAVQARGDQAWAIPWTTDLRVIYYHQPTLQALGIDEETAFTSAETTCDTLATLDTLDLPTPFVLPVNEAHLPLHIAASWIWAAGGNFMRADGRRTRFTEPMAMNALANCMETYGRHLRPISYRYNNIDNDTAMLKGEAAATLTGTWLLSHLRENSLNPDVNLDTIKVVSPPGVPLIGGSQLVVWRTTHQSAYLRELLRFLSSREIQDSILTHRLTLSARLDVLMSEQAELPSDVQKVVLNTLEHGRSFHAAYLWGMVEERLSRAIRHIWQRYLIGGKGDALPLIEETLVPLSAQLDRTLSSR